MEQTQHTRLERLEIVRGSRRLLPIQLCLTRSAHRTIVSACWRSHCSHRADCDPAYCISASFGSFTKSLQGRSCDESDGSEGSSAWHSAAMASDDTPIELRLRGGCAESCGSSRRCSESPMSELKKRSLPYTQPGFRMLSWIGASVWRDICERSREAKTNTTVLEQSFFGQFLRLSLHLDVRSEGRHAPRLQLGVENSLIYIQND